MRPDRADSQLADSAGWAGRPRLIARRHTPAAALAIGLSKRYEACATKPCSIMRRSRLLRAFAALLARLAPIESYSFWERVRVGSDYGASFWGSYESMKVHPELSRAELHQRQDLALRASDTSEPLVVLPVVLVNAGDGWSAAAG